MAGIDPTLVLAFQHRVDCDQCAVLEDANLDRMVLDFDNPAPCGVGNTVLIAAYRDHALLADPPLHGQNRFIRVRGQSQKIRCLFGKMLIHDPLCGRMLPRVGDGRAPFLELGIQIFNVAEAAPQEEVLPDIAERPLDFAFRFGPIRLTSTAVPTRSAPATPPEMHYRSQRPRHPRQ